MQTAGSDTLLPIQTAGSSVSLSVAYITGIRFIAGRRGQQLACLTFDVSGMLTGGMTESPVPAVAIKLALYSVPNCKGPT